MIGPVINTPRPFFLLNRLGAQKVTGSKEICENVFLSLRTNGEIEKEIKKETEDFKMIQGFCSWYPRQLEKELVSGCWWPVEISPQLFFSFKGKEEQWDYVMRLMGEEYQKIADFMPVIHYHHHLSQNIQYNQFSENKLSENYDEEDENEFVSSESDNENH